MQEKTVEKNDDVVAEGKRRAPGLVLRGICMGTADVIPGVSGGTIALIWVFTMSWWGPSPRSTRK